MGDGYHLSDFGAYTVGGRMIDVAGRATREINFTPTASFIYDPNGTLLHGWLQRVADGGSHAARCRSGRCL